MPVLITGATGLVGRALSTRLLAEGAQVRAYIRREDPALRAAGIHIAIGAIDDVQRLEAALTRVHTIVHLVGGWWPERGVTYDFLNRESTECAVIAARAADVRRIVFLSFPGADPGARNEFLRAKGQAETHITSATDLEHAVIRCGPVLEGLPRLGARFARSRSVIQPVALADVVDLLVRADAREASMQGTFEPGGENVTLADAIARAGGAAKRPRPPRALTNLFVHDVVGTGDSLPF